MNRFLAELKNTPLFLRGFAAQVQAEGVFEVNAQLSAGRIAALKNE